MRFLFANVLALVLLAGCRAEAPQALGTLEYDRVTVTAPATETIVRVDVREGQRVAAGARLMQLETVRGDAQLQAAQAQAVQAREALGELREGPREEAIARARAQLAAARAQAREARAYANRVIPLGQRRLVSAAEVDRARAAADSAEAQARTAAAQLAELERGTRAEQVAQGEAAFAAARAQLRAQAVSRAQLDVRAPRAGTVDSLPYEAGDRPAPGAPLAVLLVGEAPHARIYVPQPLRTRVRVGTPVWVHVDGRRHAGRVRMIRSEPVFTPYYALTGDDVARLSYLAEVALDGSARGLPGGLPVHVELRDEGRGG
ncbi:MAG TPA: HlyD family efflux transporter periplasmic adaptor subunit [Lysobacter sp.]|nr:HlyD family efflux transporter periplasmic adaptor subunit [Lysobacter sp.]